MNKKTRYILCGGLTLLGFALYILGAIILPPTIGMQIQLDGTLGNEVNKYVGLLLPLGLTVGGAAVFCIKEIRKALGISGLGILLYGITIWMNLR